MMQFTCDLCGRMIARERFEAKLEVAAAFDPDEITGEDLDGDHLQSIADELDELEDTSQFEIAETGPKKFRFDLCSQCLERFLKDPLGRESFRRFKLFSQN
ncbi:MAG: hypothetical protein ACK5Q5_12830 [Planctomycetaceae bacterium]